MKENRAIRIWQWSVVLLVVCNIALMAFIWVRPGGAAHRGPGGRAARDYVVSELKFTDEQVKQYDVLIQDHQRAMRAMNEQAMNHRQQLFGHLKDGAGADSLTRAIGNIQQQIEQVTFKHFEEVRKICTPAQQGDFDRIIGEVIRKLNGPGRNPPHGDRGDDQGPPPEGDREGPGPNGDGQGPPPGDDRPASPQRP